MGGFDDAADNQLAQITNGEPFHHHHCFLLQSHRKQVYLHPQMNKESHVPWPYVNKMEKKAATRKQKKQVSTEKNLDLLSRIRTLFKLIQEQFWNGNDYESSIER